MIVGQLIVGQMNRTPSLYAAVLLTSNFLFQHSVYNLRAPGCYTITEREKITRVYKLDAKCMSTKSALLQVTDIDSQHRIIISKMLKILRKYFLFSKYISC